MSQNQQFDPKVDGAAAFDFLDLIAATDAMQFVAYERVVAAVIAIVVAASTNQFDEIAVDSASAWEYQNTNYPIADLMTGDAMNSAQLDLYTYHSTTHEC